MFLTTQYISSATWYNIESFNFQTFFFFFLPTTNEGCDKWEMEDSNPGSPIERMG